MFRFASLATLGLAFTFTLPAAATAQVNRAIGDGLAHIHSSQVDFVNSLTPRFRTLYYRIENEENGYRNQTGCAIPVNEENLALLGQNVGAQRHEFQFVYDRMVAHTQLDGSFRGFDRDLAGVDAQICSTLGLFCQGARPVSTCDL